MSASPHGHYIRVQDRMLHEEIGQRRAEYALELEIEQIEQAARIAYLTAEHFKMHFRDLLTAHSHPIAQRRFLAMYLMRSLTTLSYSRIADIFDVHPHAVSTGYRIVKQRMATSRPFAQLVEKMLLSVKTLA